MLFFVDINLLGSINEFLLKPSRPLHSFLLHFTYNEVIPQMTLTAQSYNTWFLPMM